MSDYRSEFSIRRLWAIFGVSMVIMFGALLFFGYQIYQSKPPIPGAVRTSSGQVLYTSADIERGQSVWQSTGGMQQGSIWGHGSYVAPDWSADWLHREALALLDILAGAEKGRIYANLPVPEQARLQALLRQEMRTNTYELATDTIIVSDARAAATRIVATHFSDLFEAASPESQALRVQYAMPVNATLSPDETRVLNAFFFWTAWAAATNRPGET